MGKLGVVSIFAFFFSTTAPLAECLCTDTEVWFMAVNPEDMDHMEEFPWKLHSCETVHGEYGLETIVYVELALDHDPAFATYTIDPDGNEKIFVPNTGEWVRYDELTPILLEMCRTGIS